MKAISFRQPRVSWSRLGVLLVWAVFLSACAEQPKCVNIIYFHEDNGRITDTLHFQGKLYSPALKAYKGMIIDAKLVPDGDRCTENIADMEDGIYTVHFLIPDGGPCYILKAHGWRSTAYVFPNSFSEKHFKVLTGEEQ